jgi:hypothetical protein
MGYLRTGKPPGGERPVGEKPNQPFQFSGVWAKVDFQEIQVAAHGLRRNAELLHEFFHAQFRLRGTQPG